MSGEKRPSGAFGELVGALEAAKGREVIASLTASPEERAGDLPVRDYKTGVIRAWIPAKDAVGMVPVVYNGLVVNWYRQHDDGREYPLFVHRTMTVYVLCGSDELWIPLFEEDGSASCHRLFQGPCYK